MFGEPTAFAVYENGEQVSPILSQRGALHWMQTRTTEGDAITALRGKHPAYSIRVTLDERDSASITARQSARDALPPVPHTGDVVRFSDGTVRRVSYAWELVTDDDRPTGRYRVQTAEGGSYHWSTSGRMSYSGSLFSPISGEAMTLTDETAHASAWFFHHEWAGAGNGVNVRARVRVWDTTADKPEV